MARTLSNELDAIMRTNIRHPRYTITVYDILSTGVTGLNSLGIVPTAS